MDTKTAIKFLEKQIKNPLLGLPEEIFLFISRITPMINVDLLIKDENGRTLLSWRDDKYCGKGWHLPGGIIRFRETLETRIKKVAESEIGTNVKFDPIPIALNQVICPELDDRSHLISVLYKCFLSGEFVPQNKGLTDKDRGYLKWHVACPNNILRFHKKIYKKFI